MPITTINTILSSVKTATDIGNLLIKADSAYDKAHLKMEIEKLLDVLHEVKQQSRSIEDDLYDKDKEIKDLKEQLAAKDAAPKVGQYKDAAYKLDENNIPKGNPNCLTCFATTEKLLPISPVSIMPEITICGSCKSSVKTFNAPKDVHKMNIDSADVEILN
nr:hypothetical protein [Moritella viscosa]SHO01276.1 Putative uncharacterized protein [Moritella viscosa]